MRDDQFRQVSLFLAWAPMIWPLLLTLVFSIGVRIAGRRVAFVVLGTLICYGGLWVTQALTSQWKYGVAKSLSAGDQIAVIWIKAGLAAQLISFFLAMPFLYWLRREFTGASRQRIG
jgi:hypothetical protein